MNIRHLSSDEYLTSVCGEVAIPPTVAEIPDHLFFGNRMLRRLIIPGSVKSIGAGAFSHCPLLESVVIAEGCNTIGKDAFSDCPRLCHVVLPDSVQSFQISAFRGTGLKWPATNRSGTILWVCPDVTAGEEWIVPDTVKIIAANAFTGLRRLKKVHFSSELVMIARNAFVACGIQEIRIPKNVDIVFDRAFWYCDQLRNVMIESEKTVVRSMAFADCNSIEHIQYGHCKNTDQLLHLQGKPFLVAHDEDAPDFDHKHDPRFQLLASLCAKGDPEAMMNMALFFRQLGKSCSSPFYKRAEEHWRYQAYRNGDAAARSFYFQFFSDHPGETREAILSECTDQDYSRYSHNIPGMLLNDLGYTFFEPDRKYRIYKEEDRDFAVASSPDTHYGPDEDGFGAETDYRWWFLNSNYQPISGVESFIGTIREYMDIREKLYQDISKVIKCSR